MARTGMTVLERVKRSQQVGSEVTPPTVNQLGGAFSVQPGTSAVTAPPLATPDQVKMMGTPAQKAARVAAPTGESALEQATKLRAPAVASAEEESKKRQAAAYAGALGPMGDKVNQLVDAAMANITQQRVEAADSGLQLKVNSAAEVVKKFAPAEQDIIANLVAQIGVTTDPAQKSELVRQLNEKLGRTAESALTAEEVPAFMAAAPETVKGAAATAVTKGIGEKLTLEDLGQLGTTPEELATLIKVSPAELAGMTITDLQNRLAAVQQSQFGESQAAQAGMASSLLSSTERAALRDVLATMEETGLAGAEFQVGQIGKDIEAGRQVQIGNETYTVEELLSAPAMTDIVTKVLADPDAKTDFVKSLKETNPDLYNWVLSSKDGLEQLVKGTATAAGAFRDIQQKNIAFLKPLATQKAFFKDLDLDISKLSTKELKLEDLPPSAQYVLSQPAGAQAAAADRLSLLGAGNVKGLTPEQIKTLRPEDPNGPAAQWLATKQQVDTITSLTDPNDILKQYLKTDTDLGTVNNMVKDAGLYNALGFDGGNVGELDLADPKGVIDAADTAALKQKMTTMPSILEVAKGAKPTAPATGSLRGPAPLGGDQQELFNTMKGVLQDGFFTQEEADALPWSEEKMINVLNSLPRPGGRYVGQGVYIANTLQNAIDRKRRAREESEAAAEAERIRIAADEERRKADEERTKREEETKSRSRIDQAMRVLTPGIPTLSEAEKTVEKVTPTARKIGRYFSGK